MVKVTLYELPKEVGQKFEQSFVYDEFRLSTRIPVRVSREGLVTLIRITTDSPEPTNLIPFCFLARTFP